MMITYNNYYLIDQFIIDLQKEFIMTNLDSVQTHLKVQFLRTSEGLLLHQADYVAKILH